MPHRLLLGMLCDVILLLHGIDDVNNVYCYLSAKDLSSSYTKIKKNMLALPAQR